MSTIQQTLECLVCSNIWPSVVRKTKDAQGNEYYVCSNSYCRVCGFDENVVVDTGEDAANDQVAQAVQQH